MDGVLVMVVSGFIEPVTTLGLRDQSISISTSIWMAYNSLVVIGTGSSNEFIETTTGSGKSHSTMNYTFWGKNYF